MVSRRAMRRLGSVTAVWVMCVWSGAAAGEAASASAIAPRLRVRFLDADGRLLPKNAIRELHCRDMSDEPIVARIVLKNDEAVVVLPDQAVQLSALLAVPGFGEVVVYADGEAKGYSGSRGIDFVAEAAATRRLRVEAALKRAGAEGLQMPKEFAAKLAAAAGMPPYRSLATTLAAGEELTLALARHRIARLGSPRKGFLFGCNAFGHPARGPTYDQRFRALFNYGTANLYLTHYAPSATGREFGRTDGEVAWLHSMGMTAKVCPPIYLAKSVTPEWMKNRPYAEVRRICHDLMFEVARRYAGKVPFHEIVNEAHDYSNSLGLTPEQLTDLADVCSKATREGDPKAQRIINCCHLWGDYAARLDKDGRRRRTPYRYLGDCIRAGVEFEIGGLQMYSPEYDLFEIDRMLERYARLGKPIHITEMGCASAPGIDPNAQRKKAAAGWHGPWTEEMQADWVEGVYTIFYSKPYIEAVSWWDLADAVSFWPYGGLCRGDLSPKPAYLRLQALLKEWGYPAGAR